MTLTWEITMTREPLRPKELEDLRRALIAKRAELERRLAHHEDDALEGAVESAELEDLAEGVIEDRERRGLEEHERRLLAEINHALGKFDRGTYGMSEASGRPIALKRLRALPWARFDESEAERLEHT